MAKSFISIAGREEVMRVMGTAIQEAAQENLAAGLRTASFIDGRLVVTPPKDDRDATPDLSGTTPKR